MQLFVAWWRLAAASPDLFNRRVAMVLADAQETE